MITIRGKQYHEYPCIDDSGYAEQKCIGCSFERNKASYCEKLNDEIDHPGCGSSDTVFILDNPKHIARYVAARMGGADDGRS